MRLADAMLGNAAAPDGPIPLSSMVMRNPVGTEQIGQQSLTMPSPDLDPLVMMGSNGQPITQSGLDAAHEKMASGMNLATAMVLGMTGDAPGGIRAFHGSPHDFDAFDLSKIGTGEGAQAYGHGLYFAGNEGVAQSYRDALAKWDNKVGQRVQEITGLQDMSPDYLSAVQQVAMQRDLPVADAARQLASRVPPLRQFDAPQMTAPKPTLEKLVAAIRGDQQPGRMYEVNLHADPQQLLDWDKPLGDRVAQIGPLVEQNANRVLGASAFGSTRNAAKDAILALRSGNMTGQGAYQALAMGQSKLGNLPNPSVASATLREAGVPGIQYLDQGSRAAGEGTRNYVMFDPSLVEILRKYGLAGMLGGGTAAATAGAQQ